MSCASVHKIVFLWLCIKCIHCSLWNRVSVHEEVDVYQTDGFNSSAVTSGPIVIIDRKTIFISNLNYNNSFNDSRFRVGYKRYSTLVPDENDSEGPLKTYVNQAIFLHLPNDWTTSHIDYIAISTIGDNVNLGYVELYQNDSKAVRNSIPPAQRLYKKKDGDKTGAVLPIPNCCGRNEIYSENGCQRVEATLITDLKVFPSNETHLDYERIRRNIKFAPFKYELACPDKFTLFKDDIRGLIYNSSIIVYYPGYGADILSPGSYCVAHNCSTVYLQVCFSTGPLDIQFTYLYFSFLISSTLSLFITSIMYILILKTKDIFRQCLVGYSVSMFVTFLSLLCLQTKSYCNFFGGIFVFSMICCFVWFAFLCSSVQYIIKPNPEDNKRIYFYSMAAFIIPTVILISSIIPEGIPDVPESFIKTYSVDRCTFGDINITAFFVPICLVLIMSAISLGYISYIINTHENPDDYEWLAKKSHFKFMVRSCFLVWVTAIIWLLDTLLNIIKMGAIFIHAINFIEALQGVFVAIIFLLNKYTIKEIKTVVFAKKYKMERSVRLRNLINMFQQSNSESNTYNVQNN